MFISLGSLMGGLYPIHRNMDLKGNVAVCKNLNLEFVTKNSFSHAFAATKCFELSCAQRARSLVNCILSPFCCLYLLGELRKRGRTSMHNVVRSKPTYPRASFDGGKAFELAIHPSWL